jgi:hypothetical protein
MMAAAAVMTRAVEDRPSTTALLLSPVPVVLLLHGREQEDLVVHGEAEDDGEQHHRRPRLDGRSPADAEQAAEPAPLEDRDHHAVGGADGQQVHHHGLERDENGAEDDQQKHEAQDEHGADEPGQALGEHRREVDVGGRLAADVGHRSGRAEDVGQHIVAQVADELAGHLGLRRGGREDLGRRDATGGAGHRRRHEHDA